MVVLLVAGVIVALPRALFSLSIPQGVTPALKPLVVVTMAVIGLMVPFVIFPRDAVSGRLHPVSDQPALSS